MSDARAGQRRSLLRPSIALPALAVVVILAALLTPEATSGRSGDARLTTYSASPQGARAFYELAGRLGWRAERQTARGVPSYDSTTIRALLWPAQPLTATETHAVLEDVRRGGSLLAVVGTNSALDDSLPLETGTGGFFTPRDSTKCGPATGALALWLDWRVRLFTLKWRRERLASSREFASVSLSASSDSATQPAAVGFPMGRGRVVVMSDPDFLRNDVLRVCRFQLDVVAVRALEYLRDGSAAPRRRIVFDEYHQGYGEHPGSLTAVFHYLGATASGRTLLQIIGAALVLVIAAGVRVVPPKEPGRIERRSPLEHVEALSLAYSRVGATRTVAMRLLRGVRRRLEPRTRGAARSDESLLDAAVNRDPRLVPEVAIVRRALEQPVSSQELERVAEALDHIESSLTKPIA